MTEKIDDRILEMRLSLRPPGEPQSPNEDDGPPADDALTPRNILQSAELFTTRLQLLLTYMQEIGSIAQATTFTNMASVIVLMTELKDTAQLQGESTHPIARCEFEVVFGNDNEETDRFTLTQSIYEQRHLELVEDHGKYHDAALRILHETVVQQLVNAYEQLLGDLVRRRLWADPSMAPKDQSITFRDLLEFSSLEEAKRRVVEQLVTSFIRDNSAKEQLKYLHENLAADVPSHFPQLQEFYELVLRRHAIVHAGGVATPEYIRQRQRLRGMQEPHPAANRLLELLPSYIRNSWDTVYALGAITSHLVSCA